MEVERKVLSELRVIDLKRELEKRGLDRGGVKAVLMERLIKALQDEGETPDTHVFEFSGSKTTPKGEETDKTSGTDDEKTDNVVPEIKKEVIDVLAEEININEEIKTEPLDEVSTAAPLSAAGSDVEPLEQLEHEDEAMITLIEPEDGSLLGNDDEDDQGIQDESCNESVSDITSVQKGEADKNADDSELLKDNDHSPDDKLPVLVTVESLDRTEESEIGGEENVGNASLTDPGPATNETDTKHQQPSSAAGEKNKEAKIGGANLWVSNLSPETKATDLKRLFSRHGKLLGAKIVTSARTPGARCYGYVTMANGDDADRCIRFLHRAELHSRLIYVEKAKDDATGPLRNRTRSKESNQANNTNSSNNRRSGPKEIVRRASAPRARRRTPHDANAAEQAKMRDDRDRQRQRELERRARETKARREYEEEVNARDRERRQRIMAERLEKEKIRLRLEREKLEREKEQVLKMEREQNRLERERIEREKDEVRNRKKRLQERPSALLPRSTIKRAAADDKRVDYASKRPAIDKDELLLEPPPPPRFSDSERQRDRSRRDEKRPPPRREDYRQSSPARERYSRDKLERRGGKDDSRTSSRYDSKPKSHADGKNWSSNGTQYGGYNRDVWSTSRQDWPQTESSSRWPADSQATSGRSSYSNTVYSGTAYSGHAQPSPPGAGVAAAHSRYSDPRFDTYAHSLPVRKY